MVSVNYANPSSFRACLVRSTLDELLVVDIFPCSSRFRILDIGINILEQLLKQGIDGFTKRSMLVLDHLELRRFELGGGILPLDELIR